MAEHGDQLYEKTLYKYSFSSIRYYSYMSALKSAVENAWVKEAIILKKVTFILTVTAILWKTISLSHTSSVFAI